MLSALSRRASALRPWACGCRLLPLPDGPLAHKTPAAVVPASLPSPPPPAQAKQQLPRNVLLHLWPMLLNYTAAASQGRTSISTSHGIRAKLTAATATDHTTEAKPASRQDKAPSTGTWSTSGGGGSSSGSSSSSSSAQPCPLHACLLRHGITDLAPFSSPKHLILSQEAVSSNVEPKVAALAAEGLSPKQMAQLLGHKTHSLLACSYDGAFLPNLQLLRQIGAYTDHRPHPRSPRLSAAGKLVTHLPDATVRYLSRNPSKVQELLQWLEGSLGVGLEQLAACKSLCHALSLSAGAANAVCLSLQQQQMPAEQVAHMLLKQPTMFNRRPEVLSARIGALQQHLGLEAAAALQVAMTYPRLLTNNLEASLPPLLRFLDGFMGEEGAGRRLVRAQPTLGKLTAKAAKRSLGKLAARGYSQQGIQGLISKQPTLLLLDLDSGLQQQKLDWIERVSPWTLDDFMSTPAYFIVATRRLAARLALLRECGLQLPATPGQIAIPSSATFLAVLRKQLEKQGRELPWASWAEWEEVWLGTEEGKCWGFPPLKD